MITKRVLRDAETQRIQEIHEYFHTDQQVARLLLEEIHAEARHFEVARRAVAAVDNLMVTVWVNPATIPPSPGGATAVMDKLADLLREDMGLRARAGWATITMRLGPGQPPAPHVVPVRGALESGEKAPPRPAVGFHLRA
jgi:hypothetical protein